MAKREQDETQEVPPVTVETVIEKPLKTIETVEVKDAASMDAPELEDTYIADVAGNISKILTVKGERPEPGTPLGPFGSRVATPEQIAAYKG